MVYLSQDAPLELGSEDITRGQHGVTHIQHIDDAFVRSGDYAQLINTAKLLLDLTEPDAQIKRGEQEQGVKHFMEALDWLLNEGRRSISIQRYKGLGEMNAEQLKIELLVHGFPHIPGASNGFQPSLNATFESMIKSASFLETSGRGTGCSASKKGHCSVRRGCGKFLATHCELCPRSRP
ncbi:DNA gyrase subunit B [Andreprevotia sp. IGB-42]|uniref:hypothetical protein n=1 Tax=Andreprevotia sp. IGB-42 TaxID=2497473 RepID=UPI00157F2431|nr:hypothetical protein [Andreprevotia sp. IGB-42]KAF0813654.1 DNA gyrase subunit B [Andreprevotia sp. IGB-42]